MLQTVAYLRSLTPKARRQLVETRELLHTGDGEYGLKPDREGVLTVEDGGERINVHWYELGPEDPDAVTVVYVHGFNIAAEEFFLQTEDVAGHGVRQLLLDLRGHGQTGKVDPELLTIDAGADDVAAVMRERNVRGPAIVVGHSLGGPISLSMMRRYHHEFNLAGSVQISSAVEPFTVQGLPQILAGPIGRFIEGVVAVTPHFAEGVRQVVTDMLTPILALGFYFRPMSYQLVQVHAAMIRETPLETYAGYFEDLLHHSELDAGEVLSTIPGYILVGDHDAVTPVSQSAKLHEIWPHAYMQVLPESGHMPPLDAPGAVSTAINRLIQRITEDVK